jgi:putative chitinase
VVTKILVPPVTIAPTPPLVAPAPRNSGSPALPSTVPAKPTGPTVQTGGLGAWLKSLFAKKVA